MEPYKLMSHHTVQYQIHVDSSNAVKALVQAKGQSRRLAFVSARASGLSAIAALRKAFDRPKLMDCTGKDNTPKRRERDAWYASENERAHANDQLVAFLRETCDGDARTVAHKELEELFIDGCLSGTIAPMRIAEIIERWIQC